jgi:hypothetical protein
VPGCQLSEAAIFDKRFLQGLAGLLRVQEQAPAS